MRRNIVFCLLILLFVVMSQSMAGGNDYPIKPIPLCKALESIQPGDRIPVIIGGVYSADYLSDPSNPECRLEVSPVTCIEFSDHIEYPPGFLALRNQWGTFVDVEVTFSGILFGPPLADPVRFDSSSSLEKVPILRNSKLQLWCGGRYWTKLVVDSVLSFRKVSESSSALEAGSSHRTLPMPTFMGLPDYPPVARNIHYEGIVLAKVTVNDGIVSDVGIQFGDPVLVPEVLRNLQTWRFKKGVAATFTVTFEFVLEKRTHKEGGNPHYVLRLPRYVRVIGESRQQ